MQPRNTKKLRTTHTWLTDTINTQFITTLKLRNCMPSVATACRHQFPPSRELRKKALLKRRGCSVLPDDSNQDSGGNGDKLHWLYRCIETSEENTMPQSPHNRIAELHNLAAHAHTAAAVAHGKGDHLTAHELSKQALEYSRNAHQLSEELATKVAQSRRAERL